MYSVLRSKSVISVDDWSMFDAFVLVCCILEAKTDVL